LRLRRANGSFHVIKHHPRNSARLLSQFGYAIHRTSLLDGAPPDVDAQAVALFRSVRPFTMTSPSNGFTFCKVLRFHFYTEHIVPGGINSLLPFFTRGHLGG
jgi:hypothetical protein